MVIAIAALLLQFQAVAPVVQPVSETKTTVSSAAAGRVIPGGNSRAANQTAAPTYITSNTEWSSSRMNLDSVRLANVGHGVSDGVNGGDSDGGNSRTVTPVALKTVTLETTQNSQTFSTVRIPENSSRQYGVKEAMATPSRHAWLALAFVEHGAAAFDAYSTRQAVGHGAVEDDPIMRPFANSPAIYAATQVGPVIFDLLARHMQRSEYPLMRKLWWMPQSLSAGISIFSGVHNLSVARNQ
jgi:hypothetical protein